MDIFDHAKSELEFSGESKAVINSYLNCIEVMQDLKRNGVSVNEALVNIAKLMMMQNITELSSDPDEWELAGPSQNIWQSKRNAEAFSTDGGRTYYILSERDMDPNSIHVAKPRSINND